MKVWKYLENDPLFQRQATELTTEENKRITALRLRRYVDYKLPICDILKLPFKKRVSVAGTLLIRTELSVLTGTI